MDLLFKKVADKVWEEEIWGNYNPTGRPPHSKTTLSEDLETYWFERSKHSLPNSYSYIFGYNPHHILRAKNLNILQGNFFTSMGKPAKGEIAEEYGPGVDDYLKCIIAEQRYLSAYVIRRSVADIFFNDWEFFKQSQQLRKGILEPMYALYMDITIIDHAGKRWHAHQIIEPIVGEEGQFDLLYHCSVILVRQTTSVPFKFRIGHRTGLGEDLDRIKNMNEKLLQNLKFNIATELELTERELNFYRHHLMGYNSDQIEEKFKIKKDNQASISRDVNKKMGLYFPELMSNYTFEQKVTRSQQNREGQLEVIKKTEPRSRLNPPLVASILSDLGLIRRPNKDSERQRSS